MTKSKRYFVILENGADIDDGELVDEQYLLECDIEKDDVIYELEIKGKVKVEKAITIISVSNKSSKK